MCVRGEGRGWVVFYWGDFWLVRETLLPHPSRENPAWWIYFENYFALGNGVEMMHSLIACARGLQVTNLLLRPVSVKQRRSF